MIFDWGSYRREFRLGLGWYHLGDTRMWSLDLGNWWFAVAVR